MGKYYVDAINGSDIIGNGSRKYPYATLEKFLSVKDTIVEDTIVMLGEGEYVFSSNLTKKLQANTTLEIIGKGKKTVANAIGNYLGGEWDRTGVNSSTIKISRLFWKTNLRFQTIDCYTKLCFYNVYFSLRFSGKEIYTTAFSTYYGERYYENCVGNYMDLDNNYYPLTCVNCYFGTKSSSNGTPTFINTFLIRKSWDSRVEVDEDYRITNEDINSKGVGVYYGIKKWGFVDTLIKMNGYYYNIEPENYNPSTRSYTPVSTSEITSAEFANYSFNVLEELFIETTINEETFKPIDKFDNFSFVCVDIVETKAIGLKTQKGMAVRSLDTSTGFYDSIHYLKHSFNRTTTTVEGTEGEDSTIEYTDTTDIRVVFSTDEGKTWFTWDGYQFKNTDIIIPLKNHKDMTDEEKSQWNIAKEEILKSGISLELANTLDYNIDRTQKLRWAYAFRRDTYADTSQIIDTEIKYDMKDSYRELQDSEYDFSLFNHSIEITSHINAEEIKVNAVL